MNRIQRNFEPMRRQVESWRQTQITDAQAKLIFYAAFIDGKLDAPKSPTKSYMVSVEPFDAYAQGSGKMPLPVQPVQPADWKEGENQRAENGCSQCHTNCHTFRS